MTVHRPIPLQTTPMRVKVKKMESPNDTDHFQKDQFEDCRNGHCGLDCPYCDELDAVETLTEERREVIENILRANGFNDEFSKNQPENTWVPNVIDKYSILNHALQCLDWYYQSLQRGHCLGLAKELYISLPIRDVKRMWNRRDLGLKKVLYLIEYWEQKYLTDRMFSETVALAGPKPEEMDTWEDAKKL